MALMSRREMLMWISITVLALVLLFASRADAHPVDLYPEDGVMTVELAKHRSAWLRLMELEAINGPYRKEVVPITPHRTTHEVMPPLAPTEIRMLVEAHFPAEWVEEALTVSWCESRWRRWVDNTAGSSASGLFQFLDATWARWGIGSVYDPEANTRAAARLVQHYQDEGWWRWAAWACQP